MDTRKPESGWWQAGDVRLHYVDWPGAGPPLVCVHGLTANAHYWDALAERLGARHRLIAVDLRGRGLSDKPSAGHYGMFTHLKDLVALLRALAPGPVVAAGHSYGAYVAALLAAHHPDLVSGLVLVDGGGLGGARDAAAIQAQIQAALARLGMTFPSMAAYFQYWDKVPAVNVKNPYFRRYLEADVEQRPDGTVACRTAPVAIAEDIRRSMEEYDMQQVLTRVQAPALALWAPVGLVDPKQPLIPRPLIEQVNSLLPRGSLVTVSGANHYTILLEPEPLDQVEAALADLLPNC